jgi:hypothetical protein
MRRVSTEWSGVPGTPYFTDLYFDAASGTAVTAAAAVDTFWSAIDGALDSNISWTRQPDIATIDEVNGQLTGLETVASTSGAGTIAGETSPTVLQGLIRWRTEVAFDGRLLQGRTNVPGLPEGALDDGFLHSVQQSNFESSAAALIADVNVALVVWHRPVFSDPPTDPPTVVRNGAFAHVVVAVVGNQFAVLRSRRD